GWQLGENGRARELIEATIRRAADLRHSPSMAFALYFNSYLESLCRDAAATLSAANALEILSRENGLAFWQVTTELLLGWARGRLHDPEEGASELRRRLSAYIHQGRSPGLPD